MIKWLYQLAVKLRHYRWSWNFAVPSETDNPSIPHTDRSLPKLPQLPEHGTRYKSLSHNDL